MKLLKPLWSLATCGARSSRYLSTSPVAAAHPCQADLETFPYCDSVSFEDGGSIPCSACARSQHWAVVEMCLSGDPYDPTTLQSKAKFKVGSAQTGLQNGMQTGRQDRLESDDDDVEQSRLRTGVQTDAQIASSRRRDRRRIVDDDDDDDDYDHDSDADADEHDHDPADADAADASPLSVTVHLGKTCAHRADVYHRLHHFRFHLFLEVQAETAKLLRHVTDQMGDAADDVIHAAVVRAMLDGAGMMRSVRGVGKKEEANILRSGSTCTRDCSERRSGSVGKATWVL